MLPGGTNLLSAIVTPSVTVLDTPTVAFHCILQAMN